MSPVASCVVKRVFLFPFTEEYDALKILLSELQPFDRNSTVKCWTTGGQVRYREILQNVLKCIEFYVLFYECYVLFYFIIL